MVNQEEAIQGSVKIALEFEGGLGEILGAGFAVIEVAPEGNGRPIHRLTTQRGHHAFARVHGILGRRQQQLFASDGSRFKADENSLKRGNYHKCFITAG